jgi:hypothetical protein
MKFLIYHKSEKLWKNVKPQKAQKLTLWLIYSLIFILLDEIFDLPQK